jgi:hypothetical protein
MVKSGKASLGRSEKHWLHVIVREVLISGYQFRALVMADGFTERGERKAS